MGQTLEQKEQIIKALEAELQKEKDRRKLISKSYTTQVKEFEIEQKTIEKIKRKADQMELSQQRKEKEKLKKDHDLDLVPSREKGSAKKKHVL